MSSGIELERTVQACSCCQKKKCIQALNRSKLHLLIEKKKREGKKKKKRKRKKKKYHQTNYFKFDTFIFDPALRCLSLTSTPCERRKCKEGDPKKRRKNCKGEETQLTLTQGCSSNCFAVSRSEGS